eukprot:g1720.t1
MRWGIWGNDDKEWLTRMENMYIKAAANVGREASPSLRVPRIVHQIWIGSSLPEKFRVLRAKWIALHPLWTFRLWDDVAIDSFCLHNRANYDAAKNYGEKADIARYEILYTFGGVYLDTDMEPYKSLDASPLSLNFNFDFYAGIANTGTVELNNAIFGSRPGHPVLRECIRRIETSQSTSLDNQELPSNLKVMKTPELLNMIKAFLPAKQLMAPKVVSRDDPWFTIVRTGPGMFTRAFMDTTAAPVKSAALLGRVVALPPTFFYPFPNNMMRVPVGERDSYRRGESICTHHWAATWNKKSSARLSWVCGESEGWCASSSKT